MDSTRWAVAGGLVYDGDGGPAVRADLVIDDGRIESVEPPRRGGWDCPTVDATGLSLCPGFVDVHSHADNAPFLDEPDTAKILQGVTTEIVGNCGFSLAPARPSRRGELAEFVAGFFPAATPSEPRLGAVLTTADERGYVTNYAPLIGHGALRCGTLGWASDVADDDGLRAMAELLADGLADGAFGLSSGLIYAPGAYADPVELRALAGTLPARVPYVTHVRGEGAQLQASLAEAIDVARTGVAVHVSHLKAAGRAQWGSMPGALAMLEDARRAGLDVRQDVYPYTAGSTILAAVLPPWAREGGATATLRRLADPDAVRRLTADLGDIDAGWQNLAAEAGWDQVVIASTGSGAHQGRSIAELAAAHGVGEVEAVIDVLASEELEATMVIHSMSTVDLRAALLDPATMVGSDGLPPGIEGRPHPRGYGAFPRVLGRLAIREGWLEPGEAIRKMTALPADAFGLAGRGRIRRGYVADLVAFDETTLIDNATYDDPRRGPSGIAWVSVAGERVVEDGRFSGARRGSRLRRPGAAR